MRERLDKKELELDKPELLKDALSSDQVHESEANLSPEPERIDQKCPFKVGDHIIAYDNQKATVVKIESNHIQVKGEDAALYLIYEGDYKYVRLSIKSRRIRMKNFCFERGAELLVLKDKGAEYTHTRAKKIIEEARLELIYSDKTASVDIYVMIMNTYMSLTDKEHDQYLKEKYK